MRSPTDSPTAFGDHHEECSAADDSQGLPFENVRGSLDLIQRAHLLRTNSERYRPPDGSQSAPSCIRITSHGGKQSWGTLDLST